MATTRKLSWTSCEGRNTSMSSSEDNPGVTFKVSAVEIPRWGIGKALSLEDVFLKMEEHGVEGSGVNTTLPLYPAYMNPLVATLHTAYADHYPVVLSPDDVWTVIAQGFAIHIGENAEALRSRFVGHEGKKLLEVALPGFVKGSPTNPWGDGLTAFSAAIAGNIGPKQRDLVVGNFTTTGPVERAVSEIVLMGAMKDFFNYQGTTMCGIPEVTLLGTPADWQSIRDRAAAMGEYDLGWWMPSLLPVLDQFVAASKGHLDEVFWEEMYKIRDDSGGPYISGWVNSLFAYHTKGYNGVAYVETPIPNPYLDMSKTHFHGPTTSSFPLGMTRVPWKWNYYGEMIDMEFLGGFVGIAQDPETFAVRPALAWAVRNPGVTPERKPFQGSSRGPLRGSFLDLI